MNVFNRIRKRTKAEKRAHKAFRTITFIVGLFAILWSPYYVVVCIEINFFGVLILKKNSKIFFD